MCGIIGIISKSNVSKHLLEGLKRLEYRGYDSAGIATAEAGVLKKRRAEGKLEKLEAVLDKDPLSGTIGVAHTRWATHGAPNTQNAHPHSTDKVSVVHNGIIENFQDLRHRLEGEGYRFESETDTEVVPILITSYLEQGLSAKEAVLKAINEIEGAYALGIIFAEDDCLIAARKGSPLVLGYGESEFYIGSDAIALTSLTSKISYLEDGDVAILDLESGVEVIDAAGSKVEREVVQSSLSNITMGKENFPHYMLKEIYEQPKVMGETLNAYFNPLQGRVVLPEMDLDFESVSRVTIVACGTSYYAGMVAKYWLEQLAGISVDVDIASEFRYRQAVLPENGVAVFISQSGETADTLAALMFAKAHKQKIIAIVNVPESSIAREADIVLRTYAGPEIGVASTKAFTAQLMTLACLALEAAFKRGKINESEANKLNHQLSEAAGLTAEALKYDDQIKALAKNLMEARSIVYIGRGLAYPLALEGALKLKEISYIHAEASAAGELKHGPIALIDEHVPVVAILPPDEYVFEKTLSNIQEVEARGAKVLLISDKKGEKKLGGRFQASIVMPEVPAFIVPMIYAIPAQLLAYHVAVAKGTDVDQPRNLAKSVTVE